MTIAQIPELQEISDIQARTAAKRSEGQAIIAATGKRLAELQADMGIDAEDEEPAPSDFAWLPVFATAMIFGAAGLCAGLMLAGGAA